MLIRIANRESPDILFLLYSVIENPCNIQSHAHVQTLIKTAAKFPKDVGRIVGGNAFTRYPVPKCFGRN